MNLHAMVGPVVNAVVPPTTGSLLVSSGAVTTPAGRKTPTFTRYDDLELRVQSLGTKELAHVDALNIQGTLRAVYQYGHARGVVRPLAVGGDLLEFADEELGRARVWKVATVLETWPGWCKVVAQLQLDEAGTIAPVAP